MKSLNKSIELLLLVFCILNTGFILAEHQSKKSNTLKKQEKDIQPPDGEKWYEKGDERLYHVEIQPQRPAEGIQTGAFLYYGVLVMPPYKMDVFYKDYECRVLVNGLNVAEMDLNVILKLEEALIMKIYPDSPVEQEKYRGRLEEFKISVKLARKYLAIEKKYKKKNAVMNRDMRKELGSYILSIRSTIPRVMDYRFNSDKSFEVKIEQPIGDPVWRKIPGDTKRMNIPTKKDCYALKDSFEMTLQMDIVLSVWFGLKPGTTVKKLPRISDIVESNQTREEKIKDLYRITHDILGAKFIYYNYNPITYRALENFSKRNKNSL